MQNCKNIRFEPQIGSAEKNLTLLSVLFRAWFAISDSISDTFHTGIGVSLSPL